MKILLIKYVLYLVLVIFVDLSKSDDEVCKETVSFVTDYKETECSGKNKFYMRELSDNKCFKRCMEFEEQAWEDGEVPCETTYDCIPGFYCDENYCTEIANSCFLYYAYIHSQNDVFWKPTCSSDGKWAARQCKGEVTSGRCFCFNEDGKRLFGQAWVKDAENMTCACSRRREALLKDSTRFFTTLHCDSQGNYEELQCDSGLCWCAESTTGELKSKMVPEKAMSLLPCYSANKVGGQYLRQCDSQLYAQKLIEYELKQHGTLYANFRQLLCDDDGSFGKYKMDNNIAYCTWRDNTNLGTYQSPIDEHTTDLTCNCARDKRIYSDAGVDHNQMCTGPGEYESAQNIIDNGQSKYYCVDTDGYKNWADYVETAADCLGIPS